MHRDSLPARRRYTRLAGSADALAVARLAQAEKPLPSSPRAALDAQRLVDEMRWFAPQLRVCLLPDWETLPYDQFSPHQDLVSERLATLYRIQRGDFDVAVVPAATALVRLCPPSYIAGHTFFLKAGEQLSLERLREQLAVAGYEHVTQVVSPGEVCFRGGLIDLFPMGSALPYRIDLDDDVIDAIKTFDVDTQRTLYAVNEIRMLPAREFPLDDAGRARFRSRWRELFEGDPSKKPLYRDVSNGVPAAGIEYYLPLFFESVATAFRLPARRRAFSPCTTTSPMPSRSSGAMRTRATRWPAAIPTGRCSRRAQLFVPAEEFYVRAQAFPRIDILDKPDEDSGPLAAFGLPPLAVDRRAQDPLAALKRFLESSRLRVLIAAESPGRRETMASYFAEYGLKPDACASFEDFITKPRSRMLGVAPLARGFALPAEGWAVVTEAELYAGVVRRRGRGAEKRTSVEGMLRDLSELKVGEPVVHEQHGIGRYQGLVNGRGRGRTPSSCCSNTKAGTSSTCRWRSSA